ncbi:hypothetical protein [Burkholderia gladioli]|uniref:hypothetical protein n=1 Tax=Burkholderia gladioli TaxID=28095 RepID=UPI00163EFEEA|nr:hypothetical protein [Burkholderia gladioli]
MPIPPVTPISQVAPAICAEHAQGFLAAIVALLAAGLAGAIAFQQYRVAKAKLNLDLFERRYALFDLVWEFASSVSRNGVGDLHSQMRVDVGNAQPKIEFLFGHEIRGYVSEMLEKSASLWTIEQVTAANNGVRPHGLQERHTVLINWFRDQAGSGIRKEFGRYLDFRNWR